VHLPPPPKKGPSTVLLCKTEVSGVFPKVHSGLFLDYVSIRISLLITELYTLFVMTL